MSVGGVGSDHHDDVGLGDRAEVLGARGLTEGLLEPVAGGRVADARTGVDVVVAERGADHLLDDVHLLVRAPRRGDRADRARPVRVLQSPHPARDGGDGLVPLDLTPWVRDLLAHHGLEDAVGVRGVAEGEAALDARVALIGAAVLVRHHADEFVAPQFGLEGAADAAVRTGGEDRAGGHAEVDDRLLLERGRRARLHAGSAGDALGVHEGLPRARHHLGVEAASLDGQGECALDVAAGTHTAGTGDALGRVEVEVGVAGVLLGVEVVLPLVAVAHLAQSDDARHVLQFAVAVGGARQTVKRVVGDVELHDALAQLLHLGCLGAHLHTVGARGGAGCGCAAPAVDLDHAQSAGTEGLQGVGGTQFGDVDSRRARRHASPRCPPARSPVCRPPRAPPWPLPVAPGCRDRVP